MRAFSKQKQIAIICAMVVLIVAGAAIFLSMRDTAPEQVENNYPEFVFKSEQAPGWYSYGNFAPEFHEPSYPRDLLASTTVHQGEMGKPGECFAMYGYKTGAIDVDAALQEKQDKVTFGDKTAKLQSLGIKEIHINALAKDTPYELHMYDLQGAASRQAMRGLAFGFLPLSDGYIEISVNCNTKDGLPKILPAIPAVEFRSKASIPEDICHPKDWRDNNCVPAGKCTPGGERDHVVDCFNLRTDYDRKFDPDI